MIYTHSSKPVIIIDTRERKPYTFTGFHSIKKKLNEGDYSIEDLENLISIERKSKPDAYLSIGKERKRFEKEWIRLTKKKYAAIVIESSLKKFLVPPKRSKVNPQSAVSTYLSWSIKYNIPVFFAENRKFGEAVVTKLLTRFWFYYNESQKENKK